ncbi:uncharacterized protein [Onthophagus taurus]|uniref:uncharacterized protein isoform X1 n=2 Tax=Onthophagus taurus TaxID=166361 RepID=UPI0039BDF86C
MSFRNSCFVPTCDSDKNKNPKLYFVPVPLNVDRRKRWFEAVGLDKNPNITTRFVCCEQHFDFKNDAENLMFFKTFKDQGDLNIKLRLKPEVVPHKNLSPDVIQSPKRTKVELEESDSSPSKSSSPFTASDELMDLQTSTSSEEDVKRREAQVTFVTMPKKKEMTLDTPTRVPRRAASKEALKQMQKITAQVDSGPETLEIHSDDDEVVTIDPTPKKKYKLSHRKSADDRDVIVLKTISYEDDSLMLDSWTDDLSPAQIAMKNATKKEIDEINSRLEFLLKETSSQVIHTGDNIALYELELEVKNAQKSNPTSTPPATVVQPQAVKNNQAFQLVMDARSGVVVGTMTPATSATLAAVSSVNSVSNVKAPQTRKRTRAAANLPTTSAPPIKVTKSTIPPPIVSVTTPAATTQRATEATAVGGLSHGNLQQKQTAIVDLTSDESRTATAPDSREVSFNKLQGKTFPSLVVVARPHLRAKDNVTTDRQILDSKVKAVLMHIPTKFTEWLIQVGLIRSEQTCTHGNKLKLGMYSDVTKFPFSGGYVWISDCCPQKFVSVFSNSVFEGSPHPPTVILKLIYHWACQTNVQNVVQWVKVDNLYVKGMNTWLRAICTVAIHTHLGLLGNPSMKVEVGVISLGTTSQDGNQRQVKVEVLGVLDVATNLVRLKAVEPMVDGDRNYRRRFSKILEPLVKWVHPGSIIITDLTVDKSTLHALGFKNVVQASVNDSLSNLTIMNYLRRIVPRMFQNTLSLLSRQIIQQFLDELVWRERYGTTPALAFDNIITHLSEQTKVDGINLVHRLTKISSNPFKNWSLNNIHSQTTPSPPPPISKPQNIPPLAPLMLTTESTMRPYKNKRIKDNSVPESSKSRKSPDIPEQMVPLEHYYYGTIDAPEGRAPKITNVVYKCGMCKSQFTNNIKLMLHLFHHISSSNIKFLCKYCLVQFNSAELLEKHIQKSHPNDTKVDEIFVCVICEGKFYNPYSLGKHMSREHVPSELPYQCLTCRMRCSSHRQAVDHFYEKHDGGTSIQCPLCLKCMSVYSNTRVLTQNMSYFVQHLQKHSKKIGAKKCPKCALWFVQKDLLKDHIIKMHTSMRRKAGLVPWPVPRAIIMVPKSRQDEPGEQINVDISNVILNFNLDKHVCKECGGHLSIKDHYPSIQNCSNDNCQYTTCCKRAMLKHTLICKDLKTTIPIQSLPFKMYCVCGHNDKDGNSMAKHLTVCERKSAYPSEAEAKAATVTHSMLDVLGLMRRTEEPSSSSVDISKDEIKIEEPIITKSSDKELDDVEIKMTVDLCEDDSTSEEVTKNNGDSSTLDGDEKLLEPDENGLLNENIMDITECVSVEDDVVQKKLGEPMDE